MSQLTIDKETDVVYLLTWDYCMGNHKVNGFHKESYACKTRKSFDRQLEYMKSNADYHNIQGFEMRAVKVKI